MKPIRFLICLLLTLVAREAVCQTHIYERYADHADLEVAYLENARIDSATVINGTIIIAKDSAAWDWLKAEFHIRESLFPENVRPCRIMFRDKQDPTSATAKDILDRYLVVVNFERKSVVIYQYDTIEQYNSIINYSLTHRKYEKD